MWIYKLCTVLLGLTTLTAMGLAVHQLVIGTTSVSSLCCSLETNQIQKATAAAMACYILASFLHGSASILLVSVQYLFMLPTFINTFAIYSFCNSHDVSWGTKEGEIMRKYITL